MIKYIFNFENGQKKEFNIDFEVPTPAPKNIPEWMLMDTNKCKICPLNSSEFKICPAALEVSPVIEAFTTNYSYEKALVRVETPERVYEKKVDVQIGLVAILGLLMSKSSCPHFKALRPLGKLHLPFATSIESSFRIISAFVLRHYLINSSDTDKKINFDELIKYFENLRDINFDFLQRIRLASIKDANLNAFVELHINSQHRTYSIEEQLENLRLHFELK